jgi:hypothetical protein
MLASDTSYAPVLMFGLATLGVSLLLIVLAYRGRRDIKAYCGKSPEQARESAVGRGAKM